MTQPTPRQGQCPSCGAPIEFRLGASRATVCGYCKAIVVRAGQDFQAVGKVADLIPTGSRIDLGSHGVLGGDLPFDVIGRLQYEWQQGVWDEWYIALGDGRWGWLAEAQGRFYVTSRMSRRPLPPRVEPGQSFFIEGLGRFTVGDVKQARIVGAQGELPDPVTLGESPLTADLESEKGGFATLDYGDGSAEPVLYAGRQVPFEALHLGDKSGQALARQARPAGEKLACPSCGAPLSVRIPEQSVRVVCESCNHLLDTSQGAFRVIAALERGRLEPRIPLGSAGTLRGRSFVLVGWMVKSCIVDGVRYPWGEYLLWEEKSQSFAWLVESDGHWQLATALSVADVHSADDAEYHGKRFRHFSSVTGKVDQVLGEFYWAVQAGDTSQLDDYIRPPEGLSRELGGGEVNWTHLEHLEPTEVARAFDRPGLVKERPQGVGEVQPWPHWSTWHTMSHWMLGGMVALVVLLGAFALRRGTVLVDQTFTSQQLLGEATETIPGGERVHGYLSPDFDLAGKGALQVELSSDAAQTWAYAEGAVINETTGESAPFAVESSYYSGVDDGERWTEDNRTASASIGSPGPGPTLVRADLQWQPGHPPPGMRLRVRTESFSIWQFFGALALLSWPLVYPLRLAAFERARWENSNLQPAGKSGGED
ncbi:MAG TPA: DUF4178 domain-containing protein [Myxococcaceae bacterium]|nr:DUF4178 domain-containing protein [Myxococcaceae bacterium]